MISRCHPRSQSARHPPGRRTHLLLAALILLAGAGSARAETWSVMQFEEKMREWKADRKLPPPLTYTIEGRVSLYSKDRLRLLRCDVPFLSKSELPVFSRKLPNVEVTGKIVVDSRSGEYSFEVSSVREVASDLEKFNELHRKVRQEPADKWYELGRWAEARGEFYKDDVLLARSEDAYRHAIALERKELAREKPEALLELAEKSSTYRVPPALRQEIIHEAFYRLWKGSQKSAIRDVEDLASRMAKQLPGSTETMNYWPDELLKKYLSEPLETYASADAATRRKIHRLLYVDLMMRTIVSRLEDDASNGFEIAEQIDLVIHEQGSRAEEYRDRALKSRAAEIDKLTRTQVIELAEKYRSRQEPKQADQVLESWLTKRLRGLDPDDTEGLLDVTDDYRRLLRQEALADRLLIEAWKRNPKAGDIIERLKELGYRLFEGSWLSAAEFSDRPEGQLEQAIRQGRVETGMTAGNVRRALGEPLSKARAATAGQVTEVWTYGLSDASRLVVRFVKRTDQKESTVVNVAQQSAP
jgi:hypothetical protein